MLTTSTHLHKDDLILPDVPSVQPAHPMDSSRVLLGLMMLSRKAADAASDPYDNNQLDGLIAPGVLRSLLSALHFRDVATVRHARRVAILATGLASHLGWEGRHLKAMEVAALLHDIGKIGVPDNILFKPGHLNPDEAELMALHHQIGVDVLQACRVDKEVLEIVGGGHDYYGDTTFRRPGASIHMGARLLAIADAYDSLRTDQVYRAGKKHDEIMKILMENAGRQFDGNIVSALARWCQEEGPPFASTSPTDYTNSVACVHGPMHPDETLEASNLCHIFSYLYFLESLYDGFYVVDSDMKFVVWNSGCTKLLGYRTGDMLGRVWTTRHLAYGDKHGEPLPDHECPMRRVMTSGTSHTDTLQIKNTDNHWVEVETHTVPLLDHRGHTQGVVEIFRDASRTGRKPHEYRELRAAASRDPLTGVANRGELETQLALLIFDCERVGWNDPFSLIFLDIDHFKSINDTYGHVVGDKVLIEISRLLKNETYSGELVGRYGGEEFVILCPSTPLDQAVKRAERIRVAISRMVISDMKGASITSSFGVTEGVSGDSMESSLRRADKALYAAKNEGRNRTKSITLEEMLQESSQDSKKKEDQATSQYMLYQGSFYACVASEMVVYKLGGFVNDENGKLMEVTPNRAVVRLGSRGLFPFWGSTDDRRPVDVEVNFGADPSSQEGKNRNGRINQVLVTVRIRPVGWIKKQDVFEARARRVLKQLCSYFAAELR